MSRITALTLCASAVLAHAAQAETVTFQCSKDTSMYKESGGWTGGTSYSVICGVNSQDSVRRSLLKFDVAALIPAGATINGVSVVLNMVAYESVTPASMDLRRVLQPWGESNAMGAGVYVGALAQIGDATWTHAQFPSVLWTLSGGDALGTPSAATVVATSGTCTWASTPGLVADVQSFLDAPATNHGWLLACTDETVFGTTKTFSPRGSGPSSPRLVVSYTPFAPGDPYTDFCAGDGGGTPCPCVLPGQPNYGCRNSASNWGAKLVATGNPGASAATDTMSLYTVNITGPGLFIQGTDMFAAGAGVPFGDGLLCCSGALTRLGVRFPDLGSATYPGSLTPTPIHVAGGPIQAGDVRIYQVWYRDAAAYCTEATFNLTQAISTVWGP